VIPRDRDVIKEHNALGIPTNRDDIGCKSKPSACSGAAGNDELPDLARSCNINTHNGVTASGKLGDLWQLTATC
jgi:hypothetical protein